MASTRRGHLLHRGNKHHVTVRIFQRTVRFSGTLVFKIPRPYSAVFLLWDDIREHLYDDYTHIVEELKTHIKI